MGAVVLIAGGAGTAIYPAVKRGGWWSLVPTRVLLALAPSPDQEWQVGPDQVNIVPKPVVHELGKRFASRPLSLSEWDCLIKHRGVIKTRSRWPRDVPLAVGMREPRWMPLRHVIRLQPRFGGAQSAECGELLNVSGFTTRRLREQSYQPLGNAPRGAVGIDARLTVLEPDRTTPFGERETWAGQFRLPVTIVETMDEAITPMQSEALDSAVASAMWLIVRAENDDFSRVEIGIDRSRSPLLADLAFGVAIEILQDNVLLESLQGVISDGSERFSPPPGYPEWVGPAKSLFGMAQVLSDPVERRRWEVRVRGDAVVSLRDWDKTRYWAGELSFPLDDVVFLPGPKGGSYPRGEPDPE